MGMRGIDEPCEELWRIWERNAREWTLLLERQEREDRFYRRRMQSGGEFVHWKFIIIFFALPLPPSREVGNKKAVIPVKIGQDAVNPEATWLISTRLLYRIPLSIPNY